LYWLVVLVPLFISMVINSGMITISDFKTSLSLNALLLLDSSIASKYKEATATHLSKMVSMVLRSELDMANQLVWRNPVSSPSNPWKKLQPE